MFPAHHPLERGSLAIVLILRVRRKRRDVMRYVSKLAVVGEKRPKVDCLVGDLQEIQAGDLRSVRQKTLIGV